MATGKTGLALGGVRTQESGESPWLGRGDVESQVGADKKRTRWRGSKVVQELQVSECVSRAISKGPFGYL